MPSSKNMQRRIFSSSSSSFCNNKYINNNNHVCNHNRKLLYLSAASETTTNTDKLNKDNEYSFIRDDLRAFAMALHTKDQSPKEGQQPSNKPVSSWQPELSDYVQFLTDSLLVYETLEDIVNSYDELSMLRDTGLERTKALKEDLNYICNVYDTTIQQPAIGKAGTEYSLFLKNIVKESIPKFICHYYNHYFAHTAGGRMIGKKMSALLLQKQTLNFYKWNGNVSTHLHETKSKIDKMALTWTSEEKQDCLTETSACFKYGGLLNSYLKDPQFR